MLRNVTFVAVIGGQIVGFGDVTVSGYLDHLYVHHAHQGQGVASRLLVELELAAQHAGANIVSSDVSSTARPFFERRGYTTIHEQTVELSGTQLINYRMQKRLGG